MRKIFFLLLVICSNCANAQEKESYYIFDSVWNPVKNISKAKYFVHAEKLNDTAWQWDYYNFIGPRIKTETYRDEKGTTPNGFFAYYSNGGYLDSCGEVTNGRKDHAWIYFRGDSGKVYLRLTYNYGKLIKTEDFRLEKEKTNTNVEDQNKTFSRVEIESAFTGGLVSWQHYLQMNLKYPERAIDGNAQGEVWVLFVVDAEGKVKDPLIAKSVEFSLDKEAARMIKNSPAWVPASQDGKRVNSYKKQPIIFKLQSE